MILAAGCSLSSTLAFGQVWPSNSRPECEDEFLGSEQSDAHSRLIQVRPLQPFEIGGNGWTRTFRTSTGQALIAIIDPEQRVHVYDVLTHEPVKLAMPTPFKSEFTRGEWSEHDGKPVIHLGDTAGSLHHFGVGPNLSYSHQYVGFETPVLPLAVTTRGVLVGMPQWGRVRIMPFHPGGEEPEIEINVPAFVRAAHRAVRGGNPVEKRDLIATISAEGVLGVFELRADADNLIWRRNLETNGANATVAWFRTDEGEPALAVNDGVHVHVYLPFTSHYESKPMALAGTALAKSRVRALATRETAFIEAPGSTGSKVFTFAKSKLQLWLDLPSPIAGHEAAIFVAPNQRVYQAWTDEAPGRNLHLNVSKIHQRGMVDDPVYQLALEKGEIITDSQSTILTPKRQILMLRTNQRVRPYEILPLPKN